MQNEIEPIHFRFFRNFADEKVILGEKPMNWRMIIQTT